MKACKKGGEHKLDIQADPHVKLPQCGPAEMWTPQGNKMSWMCCHQLICSRCKAILSNQTHCPDNKDNMPQDRRWR